MYIYYAAVGLAVISNLFYHLAQKLTPAGANPALAIVVTYLVAMGVSVVVLAWFYPLQGGLGPALRQLNWASVALGVAIVGIELGFLLAYRAGGNISLAQIVVSASITLILIPVGLAFFKEKLSWVNGLGIMLCLAGLVLINIKT
jgi:uncharacterized membrane protein